MTTEQIRAKQERYRQELAKAQQLVVRLQGAILALDELLAEPEPKPAPAEQKAQ